MSGNEQSSSFIEIPCPLCGTKNMRAISKTGQYRLPAHVSICANDGLVFLNPRWTEDKYQDFYRHEYDTYYRPTVLTNETDEQKYKTIKSILARVSAHIEKAESVLDIGTGMGWSLQYLRLNYPNIKHFAAIESSEHCLQSLKEIGVEVLASDVNQNWGKAHFDFVIMRHVLEHFLSPLHVLKKVCRSLTKNGIVYIAVPNMMKPAGSLKNYWFRAVHVFYFSETTLLEFAARAGLTPILVDASTAELWGVFRQTQPNDTKALFVNIYKKQQKVIQRQFVIGVYDDLLPYIRRLTLQRVIDKIRRMVQKRP
jgi:SAM-dependent methyltransferase